MKPNIIMTHQEHIQRLQKRLDRLAVLMATIFLFSLAGLFVAGCYVGKAAFQGEKMQIYPLFSTSASTDCAETE